jgi:hypothetical protein
MSEIAFHCPHCRKALHIHTSGAGLQMNCIGCGKQITVPHESDVSSGLVHGAGHSHASTSGLAIASVVLGSTSVVLCLGPITGLPAVITGHMARARIRESNGHVKGGGLALAGLITGYLGLSVLLIGLIAALLLPAVSKARMRAHPGDACVNGLRMISGAKDQYALDHGNRAPGTVDDLVPAYMQTMPACGEGGTYTLEALGKDPTCSVQGHTI